MELDNLYAFVETKLSHDTTGHDLNHIKRVENLAIEIAKQDNMSQHDIELIRAAVFLHDVIDDKLTDNVEKETHAVMNILRESGATAGEIEIIKNTIENMSYSKNLSKKHTLSKVGEIVQDADRLDAIGAIGIARTFYYGGSKGHAMYDDSEPINTVNLDEASYRNSTNVVNHFYEKLLHLEKSMNTITAKQIAKSRTEFMQVYLKQLAGEIEGER